MSWPYETDCSDKQEELRAERDALMAHVERLRGDVKEQSLWIERRLKETEGRVTRDERGYVTNSFTVCCIPDWEMKQKREWLIETLAATPEQSLEALRAEAGRERAVQELRSIRQAIGAHPDANWRTIHCADLCDRRADEIEREGSKE